jgi:hypothetical protein
MPFEIKIGQPSDVFDGTYGDYIVDFELGEDSDTIEVVQMVVALVEDDQTGNNPFELILASEGGHWRPARLPARLSITKRPASMFGGKMPKRFWGSFWRGMGFLRVRSLPKITSGRAFAS